MTRFSGHYAAAIIAVAACAVLPIAYGQLRERGDECSSTEELLDASAIDPRSLLIMDGPKRTSLARQRLTARIDDDTVRRSPIVYTVNRAFGLPNQLLQPAASLPGQREPDVFERVVLATDEGELPFRYASEKRGSSIRTTAYFMTHRSRAIDSPFLARARSALPALLDGPHPITLFVASTQGHRGDVAADRARLEAWIRAAWRHYRNVCT